MPSVGGKRRGVGLKRDRRDERSKETPEQRENRLKSCREAQRLKRANETTEERKARLISNREAQRIKRRLQTEEERAGRREYERNHRKMKRRLEQGGYKEDTNTITIKLVNLVSSQQECEVTVEGSATTVSSSKCKRRNGTELKETAAERKIRLQLTRELVEVTRQLELHEPPSTTSTSSGAGRMVVDGQEMVGTDEEDDIGFLHFHEDDSEDSEEDVGESYQKKEAEESVEEWTDRLMTTTTVEGTNERPTTRSSRQSNLKARERLKKMAVEKGTEEVRDCHLRKRFRNETAEQAANRRAKDAERMRRRRRRVAPAASPPSSEGEDGDGGDEKKSLVVGDSTMSAFKVDRLAQLKEELERKKFLLANESPEERLLRLAEKAENEGKRQELKKRLKGLPHRDKNRIWEEEKLKVSGPELQARRVLRRRELSRKRLHEKKARGTKEEDEARRASAAAKARVRIEMERAQLELFIALKGCADGNFRQILEKNQNVINFWYNYKSHKLPKEVAEYRQLCYQTLSASSVGGDDTHLSPDSAGPLSGDQRELEEEDGDPMEKLKTMLDEGSDVCVKLQEYFSSKRYYMKDRHRQKMSSLDEEGREKWLEAQRAKWKRRYHELYSSRETREEYNARCRIRQQNRKLGIRGPGRQGCMGRNRGSKGGPGRPCLPQGFYNGTFYPIVASQMVTTDGTSAGQEDEGYADYHHEDVGGGDLEDPWEPIARAFDACDGDARSNVGRSDAGQSDAGRSDAGGSDAARSVNARSDTIEAETSNKTICEICGRIFCHVESLRRHKRYVHEQPGVLEKCPHCPMKFTRASYITWHVKRKHSGMTSTAPSVVYSCNFCNENFSSEEFLAQHRTLHHQKYLDPSVPFEIFCDICLKPISSKPRLKKHRKIVHGLDGQRGQLKCPHCPTILSHAEYLRVHIKRFHEDSDRKKKKRKKKRLEVATEKRPFQCRICSKTYGKDFQLEVHLKNKHPDGQNSTCFCEFCGKEIKIRYINDHLRKMHPKERLLKKLKEATFFIDEMSSPVKKMKAKELQSYIPAMIKCSSGSDRPGWGIEAKKPPWWPKEVPWSSLRTDIRTSQQKKAVPWKGALRSIVINCYNYHGKGDLLTEFLQESDHEAFVIDGNGKKKRIRRGYERRQGGDPGGGRRRKIFKCINKTCTDTFLQESLMTCHVKEAHPEYSAVCQYCGVLCKPLHINRHNAKSHPREHINRKEEVAGGMQFPPKMEEIESTVVCKMDSKTLRSYIPLLVRWSTGKPTPSWGKESEKPVWWDSPYDTHIPWGTLKTDARTKEQKREVGLREALKQLVTNCYRHHNLDNLLNLFNAESDDDDARPRRITAKRTRTRSSYSIRRRRLETKEGESDEGESSSDYEDSESECEQVIRPDRLKRRPVVPPPRRILRKVSSYVHQRSKSVLPKEWTGIVKDVKIILERCDDKGRCNKQESRRKCIPKKNVVVELHEESTLCGSGVVGGDEWMEPMKVEEDEEVIMMDFKVEPGELPQQVGGDLLQQDYLPLPPIIVSDGV